MHRFIVTMRYNHLLEGEFKHSPKSGQFTLFVPCSAAPNSKLSVPFCKGVPEHYDAMFGKPHGGFETSAPVVKGDQTPWELAVRDDWFQFGLWDVVWKEEHRPERTSAVASHEQIDVSDVIRHQNHGRGRGVLVESFPETNIVQSRSERV
jgi:hypothetical protein